MILTRCLGCFNDVLVQNEFLGEKTINPDFLAITRTKIYGKTDDTSSVSIENALSNFVFL
jgi:hypothetical protein